MHEGISRRTFVFGGGISISTLLKRQSESSRSQLSSDTWQQTQGPSVAWEDTMGSGIPTGIIQLSNGDYGVVGKTLRDDSDTIAWARRINPAGTTQWEFQREPEEGPEIFDDVVAADDGGMLAVGSRYEPNYGNPWYVKFGPNGAIQWERSFGEDNRGGGINAAIRVDDGGYLLGGRSAAAGSSDTESVFLRRLAATGGTVWTQAYAPRNIKYLFGLGAAQDDGFLIAGDKEGEDQLRNAVVGKVTATGDLSWMRTFAESNEFRAHTTAKTDDGGYLVAGGTLDSDTDAGNGFIRKLDGSGNKLWFNEYGGIASDGIQRLIPEEDGYIAAGMTASSGSGQYDIWLFNIDSDGTITWETTYGGPDTERLEDIAALSDGGFVFVGKSDSTDESAWIGKTRPVGWTPTPSPTDSETPTATQTGSDGQTRSPETQSEADTDTGAVAQTDSPTEGEGPGFGGLTTVGTMSAGLLYAIYRRQKRQSR